MLKRTGWLCTGALIRFHAKSKQGGFQAGPTRSDPSSSHCMRPGQHGQPSPTLRGKPKALCPLPLL